MRRHGLAADEPHLERLADERAWFRLVLCKSAREG